MSAVEAPKPVVLPEATAVDAVPAPAPVAASDNVTAPADEAPKTEELPKPEGEAVGETKEEKPEEKAEDKVVQPIHSGALGYKAPGLKK